MAHICDAIVVCCIDFRFQKFIRKWTDENLAGKDFDLVGFAGSTKELETILKQIDISVRLHQIKEAILIHHEECGAYGAESTPEKHADDLELAAKQIKLKFPNLAVKLFYLKLNGDFVPIE
jgi:carbonic anhydrase